MKLHDIVLYVGNDFPHQNAKLTASLTLPGWIVELADERVTWPCFEYELRPLESEEQ